MRKQIYEWGNHFKANLVPYDAIHLKSKDFCMVAQLGKMLFILFCSSEGQPRGHIKVQSLFFFFNSICPTNRYDHYISICMPPFNLNDFLLLLNTETKIINCWIEPPVYEQIERANKVHKYLWNSWSLQMTRPSSASWQRSKFACWFEIEQLASWCSRNNLELKTLSGDDCGVQEETPPRQLCSNCGNLQIHGVHRFPRLVGEQIICLLFKQKMYPLHQFNIPQELIIQFYFAVIDHHILVWSSHHTGGE